MLAGIVCRCWGKLIVVILIFVCAQLFPRHPESNPSKPNAHEA
jgi:hypothetical protein